MAFHNSGRIVTNGLVLSLDAADQNSYRSGSTTWFDLSGNNYSGSLVGGMTYSSAYQGGLVQNGTTGYIDVSYAAPLAFPGNTSFTVNFTIQNKAMINSSFPAILSFGEQDSGPIGGWMMYYYYNALYTGPYGILAVERWAGTSISAGGGAGYTFSSSLDSQTPTDWAYVYDSTQGGKLYKNSILVNSSSTTGSVAAPAGGPFTIGRRAGNTSRVTNCIINSVKLYNRALSAQEVLQNYNAQKSRFNLT